MRAVAKLMVLRLVSEEQLDLIMLKMESLNLRLKYLLAAIFSSTRLFSSLYYLFSSEFRRENLAVLRGRKIHLEDIIKKRNNFYSLRRNVHRIEKGLLMRPRRNVFATRFIEETLNSFIFLLQENNFKVDNSQLKWAFDVLKEYFNIVGKHPVIDVQKARFTDLKIDDSLKQDTRSIPYKRELNQEIVSLEQLRSLSELRRSVRWFTDESVDREKVDKAIEVATLSPSACNRQPFRFQIFDDKSSLKKIVKLPSGTAGFAENIPALVAVIGDLSAYPFERDRHLIYIDSSLSVMPFLYALEVQGISSCVLNWPDIEKKEKQLEKLIKIEDYERVIMFIAIGTPDPDGLVAFSRKKELTEIRRYN